jgi:hypothetical protein
MRPKTTLDSMSLSEKRKIVELTIQWCRENLGVNNRRRSPFTFSVVNQRTVHLKYMGRFFTLKNKLVVYHNNNDNVKELIKTTIHEYTHYLQPLRKYYYGYTLKYGYNKNPFEVEARKNEKKYFKKCFKSISPLLN